MSPVHSLHDTQSSTYSTEPDIDTLPHTQESRASSPPPTQLEGSHSSQNDDERMSVVSDFPSSSEDSSERLPDKTPLNRPPKPPARRTDQQPGPAPLTQRVNMSIEAAADKNRDKNYPANLNQLVDRESPYDHKGELNVKTVELPLGKFSGNQKAF